MAKDKITREQYTDPEETASTFDGFDDITAPCHACGEENVGVGTPVVMVIPGMIFPSREYDVPVFIPDPDVKFRTVQFPNGSVGFVTDEEKTKYVHEECYDMMINEVANIVDDDDDDDDEEDEEDDD